MGLETWWAGPEEQVSRLERRDAKGHREPGVFMYMGDRGRDRGPEQKKRWDQEK